MDGYSSRAGGELRAAFCSTHDPIENIGVLLNFLEVKRIQVCKERPCGRISRCFSLLFVETLVQVFCSIFFWLKKMLQN